MTRIEWLERKIERDGNFGHGPSTVDVGELVDLLRAEQRALSDAYVRLRAKIPVPSTHHMPPTPQQVWDVTEKALDRLIISPEKMTQALDDIQISGPGYLSEAKIWFVIDESTAEHEVNWPGDLISEHTSLADAKLGRAKAIIAASR